MLGRKKIIVIYKDKRGQILFSEQLQIDTSKYKNVNDLNQFLYERHKKDLSPDGNPAIRYIWISDYEKKCRQLLIASRASLKYNGIIKWSEDLTSVPFTELPLEKITVCAVRFEGEGLGDAEPIDIISNVTSFITLVTQIYTWCNKYIKARRFPYKILEKKIECHRFDENFINETILLNESWRRGAICDDSDANNDLLAERTIMKKLGYKMDHGKWIRDQLPDKLPDEIILE